jgi:transcriptional regulator with XRE-family HTH domain
MSDGLPFFAVRLRELLDGKGITAYAAAKRSGLSKQTLSALLAGKQGATWDTVQRLCLVLGVSPQAFVDPGLRLPQAEPRGMPGKPRRQGQRPGRAGHARRRKGRAAGP